MKINHKAVAESLEKAVDLRRTIATTDDELEKLRDPEATLTIYPNRQNSIAYKLEKKTIDVLRTLAIQDLEEFKKPLVEELQTILSGGIIHE